MIISSTSTDDGRTSHRMKATFAILCVDAYFFPAVQFRVRFALFYCYNPHHPRRECERIITIHGAKSRLMELKQLARAMRKVVGEIDSGSLKTWDFTWFYHLIVTKNDVFMTEGMRYYIYICVRVINAMSGVGTRKGSGKVHEPRKVGRDKHFAQFRGREIAKAAPKPWPYTYTKVGKVGNVFIVENISLTMRGSVCFFAIYRSALTASLHNTLNASLCK